MKAVQILVRASNQGLIDPRSVSMIILVSDGDPTVGESRAARSNPRHLARRLLEMGDSAGEIKLSTIQKNVKKVMREDFSLFSLGIGFDVDYDFLERIAMDNRGIAQRIFANHDAAQQLRVGHRQEAMTKTGTTQARHKQTMNPFYAPSETNLWSAAPGGPF